MSTPSIAQGQIAIDPVNGILYYKTRSNELVHTSLNLLQESNTLIVTEDSLEVGGDFVVSGDFTVSGNTVILNTETLLVEDNIIILNSNVIGTPTVNAGIEINRGNVANVQIIWNETLDKWQFTNDGINYYSFNEQISTANSWTTARTITLSGDLTGNVSIDGSSNVTLSASVVNDSHEHTAASLTFSLNDANDVSISNAAAGDFLRHNGTAWINDPVDLATDTVGNYVQNLVAGTGILLSNNSGESATPTVSVDTTTIQTRVSNVSDIEISYLDGVTSSIQTQIDSKATLNSNVSFNTVTANFIGNVTGSVSSISTHNIDELADVVITSAQNGQLLQYNGSAWVNSVMPSSEPIGHENKADSVISFNEGSREFSIAPSSTSYVVWCKGKRYVKTTTETISIPDVSGLYYIYFNSNGSLAYKTTYFDWENDTPTAYIYWNQDDDKAYFFADERHGVTLDWATHEYLHRTRGAVIANGFGANGYTTTGSGSLDSHAVISIANGTFFDEDLQVDITHSATPTANTWEQRLQANAYIPIFYHSNTHWKKDVATQFPMKQGTARVQYNLNTAGVWSTSDIDNNKWGVTWIVATNNLNEPILGILGQDIYLTIGEAEAAVWEDLNLDGFPIFEFRPLYKVVYQTANAYGNTPHATIQNVLDLRRIISSDQGIPTTPVSDHGSMTGLSDNDHPQYLLVDDHDTRDHSNALSTASIDDLSDVVLSNSANGDFLRYNGSVWINDPVNLSTDTIGDYVKNIIAGEAIEIDVLNGEGATPTISIQDESITSAKLSPTFEYVDRIYSGNNIVLLDDIGLGVVSPNISVSATPSFESVTTTSLFIDTIEIDPSGANSNVQVLRFDTATNKFIPGLASTVAALSDLTDVSNTSPTIGDFLYWNGTVWAPSVPATGMPIVSDTAPVAPSAGQLWFDSSSARTFIYYVDSGASPNSQWVEIGSAAPPVTTVTKYAQTIGDGTANTYVVTHNLNTKDIVVDVYDTSTDESVDVRIRRSSADSIEVDFSAPISLNSYRVVVIG